jgi:hypothetical protein
MILRKLVREIVVELGSMKMFILKISDHQQNWGYKDGLWKEPGSSLLVAADF